jgi:hypothetical protein
MMKFGALIVVGLALIAATPAQAENWKKNFCGNQDYIPAGGKYPHLHCGSDFYTYSASSSKHVNMAQGDKVDCAKVRSTIDTIKALDPNTAGKADMQASTVSVGQAYCKKKDGN